MKGVIFDGRIKKSLTEKLQRNRLEELLVELGL
jgi:hypothetical protein